jgi:hypothetical protein
MSAADALTDNPGGDDSASVEKRLNSVKLIAPGSGLSEGTGFMTWNAALVTKEYLLRRRLCLSAQSPSGAEAIAKPVKLLDVSSGNGFLAIAAACMGAHVICTECFLAYRLLAANIEKNLQAFSGNTIPEHVEYAWGEEVSKISEVCDLRSLDMVIMSDLLYIAIRDDLEDAFFFSIISLVPAGSNADLIFSFERRKYEREDAFLVRLGALFHIEEVDVSDLSAACLQDDSGREEESELSMFYRAPPVRLLIMRRRKLENEPTLLLEKSA